MRIEFEFLGGPRDGERLAGFVEDGVLTEAACVYRYTDGACVGTHFWCKCEYTVNALRTIPWSDIEQLELAGYRFRGHVYEVFERQVASESLLVRARHLCAAE
ncbi:MAG TPA: hypothetical protein VGN12_05305 [Pirellulales bacterium]|jgi:hypothetical protein